MGINRKRVATLAYLTLGLAFSGLVVLIGLYLYVSPKLPSIAELQDYKYLTPLRVYTSDQKLIGEFGEKRRLPISYEEIPQQYIQALLAIEDQQFFSHYGISIRGFIRSAINNLRSGRIRGGGSTITMQVARNIFPVGIGFQQTYERKIKEIFLALNIERKLTKKEILELYVNQIYLGKRAYGIQAASRVYYGKPVDQLSLAQLAMIVGVAKGPTTRNPINNPAKALERRNYILERMRKLNFIGEQEYTTAVEEPMTASYHGLILEAHAPYAAEQARRKALQHLGDAALTEGFQVYTTIDSRLQNSATEAVRNGLLRYDWRHGYRGPEQRLKPVHISTNDAEPELDLSPWIEALSTIPTFADLFPAAITQVHENSIEALLNNGQLINVDWDKNTRRYISASQRSSKIATPGEMLAPGDIIRVMKGTQGWVLRQLPQAEAALVGLAPDNGAIRSLVGGFDFKRSAFNRVTQATRQPGSSFKPFIYLTALEQGYSAATIVNDSPYTFDDGTLEGQWRPNNDGGKYLGPVRLRQALYRSINSVSIRVLRDIGVDKTIKGLERFGFESENFPRNLALALGSHAQTPLQMATAYSVIANGGFRVEPHLITSITDVNNDVVYSALPPTVCLPCESSQLHTSTQEHQPPQLIAPRVIDAQSHFIIDSMLKDVIDKGTGRRAKVLKRADIGGKTGTTNGPRDAWFSGYHEQMVATAWVGFDQNTLLGNKEYGGVAALPIWIDFMKSALRDVPESPVEQPDGLVSVSIDSRTGKRTRPDSPNAIFEVFKSDNLAGLSYQEDESTEDEDEFSPFD